MMERQQWQVTAQTDPLSSQIKYISTKPCLGLPANSLTFLLKQMFQRFYCPGAVILSQVYGHKIALASRMTDRRLLESKSHCVMVRRLNMVWSSTILEDREKSKRRTEHVTVASSSVIDPAVDG